MRIDVKRLDRTIDKCEEKIQQLKRQLEEDEVGRAWRKEYGGKTNMGSRSQLAHVLFDLMGCKADKRTKSGRHQVNEEVLESLDLTFVRRYLKLESLKKLKGTYLQGVKRELVGEWLRPSFNLHLVRTHRGSSDSPNFQNIPIRDPSIGKAIRSCFIPRDGHVLVEIDYGALEFRICSCFWKDKSMVAYASDPKLDIHRDMAMECYKLTQDQVTKQARFYAKNQFVFPQLYGSYYINCARNLWSAIEKAGLTTADGVGLYEHLKSQGINSLGACDPKSKAKKGTFEHHVQQVEQHLAKRFPQWAVDRDVWWKKYQSRGWFRLMTGFVMAGVFKKNDLMNWPIQGPAFHCLLWSLIRLVKWLKRNKMRTVIIGQIHDSILADVHRDELEDYLQEARRVMTVDVREAWSWIITPLEVECEVAETNWFEKKAVEV